MDALKAFLVAHGILKDYISCITDERTKQQGSRSNRHISSALTSYHVWSLSEKFYHTKENDWGNYHILWSQQAPDVTIPSRDELVTYFTSKKSTTMRFIKGLA